MTHDEVQAWLDRYIAAWASNDGADIRALFTEDAIYSYRPWESEEHTVTGRQAIIDSWLEHPADPSMWEASYRPYVVEGNRAVAVGWSRYFAIKDLPERLFHNAYLLEFDGAGRCSSFHEFWFLEKE